MKNKLTVLAIVIIIPTIAGIGLWQYEKSMNKALDEIYNNGRQDEQIGYIVGIFQTKYRAIQEFNSFISQNTCVVNTSSKE